DALVDAARALADASGLVCGTSALHARVIVLRALGGPVEPLMQLLIAVRASWRRVAWDLAAAPPRIWQT
ncbi:MAG: urease accessory protein UreD, partial [Rubrivivax sp.]